MVSKLMGRIGPTTQERIAVSGSPTFRDRLGAINAGARTLVNLDTGRSAIYAPFNHLTIVNNSDEELTLRLNNGARAFRVLARDTITVEGNKGWYRSFSIENNDGANATGANEIEYIAERLASDADSEARRNARLRFRG